MKKISPEELCSSCTNIGCEFQSGIVRTECAFYMPPHKVKTITLNGKKYIDMSVIEDIKTEITGKLETIVGKYDSNTKPEDMPSRKIERNYGRMEAIDIINRKIEEIEHDNS